MKYPKISVIMSVYNTEKYLAESIESILNQTFRDFEFIIIDDYSKDNSLKIIKEYAKKDSRIKIIKNIQNLKLAASLNKGLKIAHGKYIAIMDSDDISLPERFEVQYNFLEENKDTFLLATSWESINENGDEISKKISNLDTKKIIKKLPFKCVIQHPTVMFRNESSVRYREKFLLAQDRDLWLRFLSENKKMRVIPKILSKIRINPNSVSIKKSFEQEFFTKEAIKYYYQRLKTGEDDYKYLDPERDLEKLDKSKMEQHSFKIELISYFRRNFGGRSFRKQLINYWEKYGYYSWKVSIIYYFISFMPKSIIKLCLNVLDKF